nr:cytochrome P450 monooxygenase CYP334B1 [Lasioderma serricorne]
MYRLVAKSFWRHSQFKNGLFPPKYRLETAFFQSTQPEIAATATAAVDSAAAAAPAAAAPAATPPKPEEPPAAASTFVKIEHVEPIQKALPYDDIPGPVSLQFIAKMFRFIPVIGTKLTITAVQHLLSGGKIFGAALAWSGFNLWYFRKLHDNFGPVVRLHGPFGGDVVVLCRPEHIHTVYLSDGPYPTRSCLDCVEKYRVQYRRYKNAGPFLMSGPEWAHVRKAVEQPLHKCLETQFDMINESCDDFLNRIVRIRNIQDEVTPGFKYEIYKWALECLCAVMLNKKLGFLDPHGLSSVSEPSRLMESLHDATDAIRRCESGLHMWKLFETPSWKTMVRHCDVIDGILNKHIQKAQESLRAKKVDPFCASNASMLETLLMKDNITPDDVLTVMLDMLIIGMNTTMNTVAFLMYHLARTPRVQYKLYEEIKAGPATPKKEDIPNYPYLQACIKECLRLNPSMPVLSRVLNKDVVLYNYLVPKGTIVMIATHLSGLREEFYEDPYKYKPERWLAPDMGTKEIDAMASIPYGFGPRACFAKELVESMIGLLMVKLVMKFRLEYHYGEIRSTNKLFAAPNRPLKFRFVERV